MPPDPCLRDLLHGLSSPTFKFVPTPIYILVGNGTTRFYRTAGAALRLSNSYILPNYSTFQFEIYDNFANSYGGGIYIDFSLPSKDRSQCH